MSTLPSGDVFARRHIGPTSAEIEQMLATLKVGSLDELIAQAVPQKIRTARPLDLPKARTEREALHDLAAMASMNEVWRSYIGLGFHDTITPPVVLRNVLENPGWYTAYTPYQAEISQGRLEALLNFQTMVTSLCGMEVANASMLDEATAAAEAMTMSHRLTKTSHDRYFVDDRCHPHTIDVVKTRAAPLGIDVVVGRMEDADLAAGGFFGALVQYPDTDGIVRDVQGFCARAHSHQVLVTVATDLLALALLKPPGEMGADIAIGNSQRFGVPLGYGGPHAGFLACREDFKRQIPGRLIGVSKDVHGNVAYRMTLQTREQHIRRDKATSNICTAQVLLAVVAGMYAVWHGPEGIRRIARRVHHFATALSAGLHDAGYHVTAGPVFDTLKVDAGSRKADVLARCKASHINLRHYDDGALGIALDETVSEDDFADLLRAFGITIDAEILLEAATTRIPEAWARSSDILTHPVFRSVHSETDMLRYLHVLQAKDLALDTSMIPLGSCTMKLNATTEMIPVTWAGFGRIHPFAPLDQTKGYQRLFKDLEDWLAEITGFAAVSLQPNAGSQGEYAGLLTIRAWHASRGDHGRNVCLIPASAHGTNPASAVMAGMTTVAVRTDAHGNIDVDDLRAKAEEHKDTLAALMVTYPSTHGVFETEIRDILKIVHDHGGKVYMDGANMNAMVGLVRPGELGADVCHLNLHKTFCIPHGGGGPGMGPIGVSEELAPFLPGHPLVHAVGGSHKTGAVSAAPWGSASILPISWAYIAMMGGDGLTLATKVAILNANYIAARVKDSFPVLYAGGHGRVAHECIFDPRAFKDSAGIEVDDIAKRLMDYGFHAPTMSFPVAGTLMVEPTESESKAELDRFCDALIAIRGEIAAVESGRADREDNPLKHAPHTAHVVTADSWEHAYGRQQAAFPAPWTRHHKYWPTVGRIDNAYGDRHFFCACPPWGDGAAPILPERA